MTEGPQTDSLRSARWLTPAIGIVWAVCFWPARWLRGDAGIYWMSMAAICCLAIGWIVAFLSRLAIFRGPLTGLLVPMTGRLVLISSIAMIVKLRHPELGIADFYGWLIGFYLLSPVTDVAATKLSKTPSP